MRPHRRRSSPRASASTNTEFTVPAGGTIQFTDDTSAGQSTFSGSGDIVFFLSATATDGVFTLSGPSGLHTITFNNLTSAGNSTLIATAGGIISFEAPSVGGTARVELWNGSPLWTYIHNLPGVTIGSLEGNGVALIGSAQFNRAVKLTIGSKISIRRLAAKLATPALVVLSKRSVLARSLSAALTLTAAEQR